MQSLAGLALPCASFFNLRTERPSWQLHPPHRPISQPALKRVAQQDRHDDTFAAIAILTGKTLDSVMRRAETMGLPKVGPYHGAITGDLIAKLLAAEGLVASV